MTKGWHRYVGVVLLAAACSSTGVDTGSGGGTPVGSGAPSGRSEGSAPTSSPASSPGRGGAGLDAGTISVIQSDSAMRPPEVRRCAQSAPSAPRATLVENNRSGHLVMIWSPALSDSAWSSLKRCIGNLVDGGHADFFTGEIHTPIDVQACSVGSCDVTISDEPKTEDDTIAEVERDAERDRSTIVGLALKGSSNVTRTDYFVLMHEPKVSNGFRPG